MLICRFDTVAVQQLNWRWMLLMETLNQTLQYVITAWENKYDVRSVNLIKEIIKEN